MTTPPLDVEIRSELERRRGDWPKIALKAGISYAWVSKFVRLKIPNPGYATLTKLRVALFERKVGEP